MPFVLASTAKASMRRRISNKNIRIAKACIQNEVIRLRIFLNEFYDKIILLGITWNK